jgi:hypothetical protein
MGTANHLNRRRMLKGASAVGLAGMLATQPAVEIGYAEPVHRIARGPVGSWVATVTITGPGAPPAFQALRTYADGGGYVESSSNSHNPQARTVPPMAPGSAPEPLSKPINLDTRLGHLR